jgi:hypothetical protein
MNKLYLLITAAALTSLSAGANIVYTDVVPDSMNINNFTLDIDVNNDGTMDFEITGAQAQTSSFDIVQAGQVGTGNFVLSDGTGGASALALNTVIGASSSTWFQMNSTNLIMITIFNNSPSGNWVNATDKYLGLKFIANSNTYYGWARFTIGSTSNQYTFKDYAYEDTPGQSILAGQTITGVSPELSRGHLICYPNPAAGLVRFADFNTAGCRLTLTDMSGKVVLEQVMDNDCIDVSKLENGIYFYSIRNSGIEERGQIEIAQ